MIRKITYVVANKPSFFGGGEFLPKVLPTWRFHCIATTVKTVIFVDVSFSLLYVSILLTVYFRNYLRILTSVTCSPGDLGLCFDISQY